MKAVILCGGQGTRIRDVAENIPKPMLPIGERPILWHIMKRYARFGTQDFVLCLGYRGWTIKEYFLNYRANVSDLQVSLRDASVQALRRDEAATEDWQVTLAETGLATQTGGRFWRVRRYVESEPLFFATYGDGVADLNFDALVRFHRAHGKIATVTGVRPPGRFGVMRTEQHDQGNRVLTFEEKPQTEQGWINGGFFVFDQRIWSYLSDDPELVFERQPLANLAKDGQLMMFEHSGFWQPMDTYREWKLLNELWNAGNAPWAG